MKITPIITGSLRTQKHRLVKNTPPGIPYTVPVPCYLLEHKGEFWLFDAGEIPPEVPQKEDVPFYILMKEEERAVNQLSSMGITPEMLNGIILSHCHSDHIDGIKDFPHTPIFLQKREEENLPSFVNRENCHFWEGEKDLFGDGKCIFLPTFGHTRGHQSLLALLDDARRVLLTVDAAYTLEELERGRTLSAPENEQDRSLLKILALEKEGVTAVPGHDPCFKFAF